MGFKKVYDTPSTNICVIDEMRYVKTDIAEPLESSLFEYNGTYVISIYDTYFPDEAYKLFDKYNWMTEETSTYGVRVTNPIILRTISLEHLNNLDFGLVGREDEGELEIEIERYFAEKIRAKRTKK